MQVALAMLLCLAMVHAGLAHSLPNMMFQSQDAALPKVLFQAQNDISYAPTEKCTVGERLNYLVSLPNGINCVLSLKTITNPFATELEKANALITFCREDCGGAFVTFLESSCDDQQAADHGRMICNSPK